MIIHLNDVEILINQVHLRSHLQNGLKHYFPTEERFDFPIIGAIPFLISEPQIHSVEIAEQGILTDVRIILAAHSTSLQFAGTLDLQVLLKIEVADNKLKFESELSSIQWSERPVIELAGLNIGLESISTQLVSRYGPRISSRLTDRLEEIINHQLEDLSRLIGPHLGAQVSFFQLGNLVVTPTSCYHRDGVLMMKVQCEGELLREGLSSNQFSKGDRISDHPGLIRISLRELEYILLKQVKKSASLAMLSQINDIKVSHSGEFVIIDLFTSNQMVGAVRVKFRPSFAEHNQLLYLSDIEVTPVEKSIISRLFTPAIKLFALNKLKKRSPLNLRISKEALKIASERISTDQLDVRIEGLKILSLNFAENGLECYFDTKAELHLDGVVPISH